MRFPKTKEGIGIAITCVRDVGVGFSALGWLTVIVLLLPVAAMLDLFNSRVSRKER